jgi:hypothetical protein
MQEIIPPDYLGSRIGEKRERKTQFPCLTLIYFGCVGANGHDLYAACLQLRKPFLKTPQLGVAEWSPMTAVEDQQNTMGVGILRSGQGRIQQFAELNGISVLVRQSEFWSFLAHARGSRSRRQSAPFDQQPPNEEANR